jgi:hypothetical protein
LLLPSRPSPVSGWVLRVFPARAPHCVFKKTARRVPLDLRFIFRAARNGPETPRRDCSRSSVSPLVGFVRVCPSSDMPRLRPLPVTLPPLSSDRCQPASAFRPCGFSPPRRFTPHSRSRACCIPVPEGVRRVSSHCHREPVPPSEDDDTTRASMRPFPQAPFTPLEEVPPTAAASHHCDRCLLAVKPPPLHNTSAVPLRRPSTSRLCSAVGSVAPVHCCQQTCALSFHGFRSPPGYWVSTAFRPGVSPHLVRPPRPPVHPRRCRQRCPPPSLRRLQNRFPDSFACDIPPAG